MSRQIQISKAIVLKKEQISDIDIQIWKQTNRQQVLDDLLRELDFSSSDQTSFISSNNFSQEEWKPSIQNIVPPQNIEKPSPAQLDCESLQNEDISFEIDKIRLFQQKQNSDQQRIHRNQISQHLVVHPQPLKINYINRKFSTRNGHNSEKKEPKQAIQQQTLSNAPKQAFSNYPSESTYVSNQHVFNSGIIPLSNHYNYHVHKVIPSIGESDLKLITFQNECQQQVRIESMIQKARQNFITSQAVKVAFLKSAEQKEKIRIQKLESERKIAREQLLNQRHSKIHDNEEKNQSKSSKYHNGDCLYTPYKDNERKDDLMEKTNLNEDKDMKKQHKNVKNSLSNTHRKQIFHYSKQVSQQIQVYPLQTNQISNEVKKSLNRIYLGETLIKSQKKTRIYSRYIQKSLNSLDKTHKKIDSYRKFILNG